MIRREEVDSSGQPRWVLIDQIAHAQLAGQFAQNWRLGQELPPGVRDALLAAVFHHDDGWSEWDADPGVVAEGRRPLNFNEMPMVVSTEIWRRSIATAATLGPLPRYVVAGHFSALLVRFGSWRQGDEPTRRAAERFLTFAEHEMAVALAEWQAAEADHAPELAATCLHLLQMFDALSLWFCCAPRTQPEEVAVPNSPAITLLPDGLHRVVITPWPLLAETLTLEIAASSIPAVSAGAAFLPGPRRGREERLWWELQAGQKV